jgi:hypothetical protein
LVNFISNNVLPHDANVLRICITLIHKLKAVERKEYNNCWSCKNTDVPLDDMEWNPVGEGTIPSKLVAGDFGRDSSAADEHRTWVSGPDSRLETFGVSSAAWYKTIIPEN